MKDTEKDLLEMELHSDFKVDGNVFIRRVVGGWLYEYYNPIDDTFTCSTFVPEVLK